MVQNSRLQLFDRCFYKKFRRMGTPRLIGAAAAIFIQFICFSGAIATALNFLLTYPSVDS
jgi:hypothetical protein